MEERESRSKEGVMDIEVKIATLGDAAAACSLLRRTISECCAEDHRNDASILAIWLGNKTPENVASWFLSPTNFSFVAVVDNDVAGVAILAHSGKIVLFYVSPQYRFTGVGKALLHTLETQAVESGLRSLQVPSTLTAKPFYLRNGFVVTGITVSAFGTEAVTMSKNLGVVGVSSKKKGCGCGVS